MDNLGINLNATLFEPSVSTGAVIYVKVSGHWYKVCRDLDTATGGGGDMFKSTYDIDNDGVVDSAGSLRGGKFNIYQIDGDLWIVANAYYDENSNEWSRINTSRFALAIQIQGTNNIPNETVQGINFWRAVPGDNPIGDFGEYGGWEAVQIWTAYKDTVVGGFGIEVDGNGLSPYGRFVHTESSTEILTGILTNAYADLSGQDMSGECWFVGISKNKNDGGYKFVVKRKPDEQSDWIEVVSIDESGLPGGGDMLKSTYDSNNDGLVDSASALRHAYYTIDLPLYATHDQLVKVDLNAGILSGVDILDFAQASHDHDDRYYTETETNTLYAPISKGVTNGDSHDHYGGDGAAITENAISLSDVTTNNASTTKHGFCPKLSGSTSQYLRGDGNWATPSGGGSGWTLLYTSETDGTSYSNTTSETTLYTYSLAANSYSYILIETIVFASDTRDSTSKVDWTLRIKYDGTTQKQFDTRTLANSSTDADSGEKTNIYGTYIMTGGQTSAKDITVTFQASVANASVSFKGKMCRVWGIP